MKVNRVTYDEPKSKQAALHLAAYMIQQLDHCKQRKENLAMNKTNAEEKIKRLQETLLEIQNQIEKVDFTQKDWEDRVGLLKTKFSLTESEILETKSELLRQQITNLQKLAGVKGTGHTDLI